MSFSSVIAGSLNLVRKAVGRRPGNLMSGNKFITTQPYLPSSRPSNAGYLLPRRGSGTKRVYKVNTIRRYNLDK